MYWIKKFLSRKNVFRPIKVSASLNKILCLAKSSNAFHQIAIGFDNKKKGVNADAFKKFNLAVT
jgi:hypothetical protein